MKTSVKLMMAVLAAAALTACGGGDSGATVGSNGTVDVNTVSMPGADCGYPNFAKDLLAQINAARASARSCGDTSFQAAPAIPYWNTLLANASAAHSNDMSTNGFFSHTGSDGSNGIDRLRRAGYPTGGEGEILTNPQGNIAPSQLVSGSMNAWLASPGHCSTIMRSASVHEIGGACVKNGNNAYITVNFGN